MLSDIRIPLEAAAELGRRASAGQDYASLLGHAMEVICLHLHVGFSSFLELLPTGDALFQAGVGWNANVVGRPTDEMSGESAAAHVIRTLSPLALNESARDRRFVLSPLLREHGIVSVLIVPLLGPSRPLGVLGAYDTRSREFSAEEAAWLQVIANVLAARLVGKSLHQSEHDQQMLRAEQMMAIGQVAAGVAHELRNPLTSIKGLIQVNLRELEGRGTPAEDLEIIDHEIRRMEKTLQNFLDFARPPQPDRRLQLISPIIQRVLALVGGRARKQRVEIRLLGSEALISADVDGDQIQQLLLNLVLNALDMMPHGGLIEIEQSPPRDGYLEIYVRDTGPGITPDILPKLFETFVSSKETGVGLGLPLSKRIAEDHGGALAAYNLPVEGACFLLRLPIPDRTTGLT